MFNLYDAGGRHRTGIKAEEGRLLVRTVVDDSDILANNAAHRSCETKKPGDPAPIHPRGAETIYHFQIEPHLWEFFKKDYPELYADLMGADQIPREKAAARIAALHPEWVVCAPRVLSLGDNHA